MTNTVTVVNQPSTTHAATIKVFTPSSFKERSTAVAPNGTITSQFVYNSGVLTTDTVVTVQSAKNADGTLHNTLSIITDRVVADGSGIILETKPINAGIYWESSNFNEDAQTVVDLIGSLFGLFGLITADGAPNLGLVQAIMRDLTRSALG